MNAPEFDRREFRNALGAFPTGVAVVTTRVGNGALVGLTVNSFSSLSLDPPLVLWSLNTNSPSLDAFEAASHFAINILAVDQVDISRRFSTPQPDKFASLKVHEGAGGSPIIDGCAAAIECRSWARHAGGDHTLFIGHVERFAYSDKRPLVFHAGRYHATGDHLA